MLIKVETLIPTVKIDSTDYALAEGSDFQLGSGRSNSKPATFSLLDMLKAYATGFYKIALSLQALRAKAGLNTNSKNTIPALVQKEFEDFLSLIEEECRNLELAHTLAMAVGIESRYRSKISNETTNYFLQDYYTSLSLFNDLDTLDLSFSNELASDLIFRIAPSKIDYFEKDDLFGSEVTSSFPSAVEDVRNAGTCFAVEQWDASVFHLMRVLERGLRVLATKFTIPFQNTTWHTVIEQIEKSVRKMDSSFGPDWKEQQKFYSQAASQFMFLKDAWRNHIMHLGDVYDEGKALSVLTHVRMVMRALADGGLHE